MKYSDKEQRLIYALRFEDFLNQEPAVTYRALALYCFSKNLQNYLADNVRRCYNALQEGTPYRLTKEFDDLIEFPPGRTTREYLDDKMVIVNGIQYQRVEEQKPQTLFDALLDDFDWEERETICRIVRGWLIDHTVIETEDAEKVTFTILKEQLQTPK